ncbi:ABC transporter permease [Synechococcus sp. CS-1329]|uniref:ABC transporter permease n=1 Tax=Synechococcus sp. CS-1329 TaxID=2847975 RepID=UPI00223B7614|nr:ABC transporter permease [Synechococcus sp. CS-1329]MCT0218872.1 ABC transporter permease [Synechococcus sp. CS-1329]
MQTPLPSDMGLRQAKPATGHGLLYACRTARAWWYSAWLRTLARFSRTTLGSFWMGLSNLLSVAVLGVVYSTVLKVPDPLNYIIFLGFGITIWGLISMSSLAGSTLFTLRRDQLVNNALPSIFYCLEEWAFQLQTFVQAFVVILVAFAFVDPGLLRNAVQYIWLPMLNLSLFSFWIIVLMAVLGARFKDFAQLMPILLQLLFLVSPILYKREGLGRLSILADFNPFYQALAPVRNALIDGQLNFGRELLSLGINGLGVLLAVWALKRLRYRLPLWV